MAGASSLSTDTGGIDPSKATTAVAEPVLDR